MTSRPFLCILLLLALSMPSAIPLLVATGMDYAPDSKIGDMAISFIGNGAGDYFGMSVAGVGDVSGDGFPDILVGTCTQDSQGQGQGPGGGGGGNGDGGVTGSGSGSGSSGSGGASAGNGQGSGTGSGPGSGQPGGGGTVYPSPYGHVYLILGRPVNHLGKDMAPPIADVTFVGETTHELQGCNIGSAGDVNGDGLNDFLIGSHLYNESGWGSGTAYLMLGRPSFAWPSTFSVADADASFIGAHEYDAAGYSVSSAGDVNGDGFDDILITAWTADYGRGETALFFGKASGWENDINMSAADVTYWGKSSYEYLGYSASGVGDVNGDGYDDIMMGAPDGGHDQFPGGEAYLFYGKALGWEKEVLLSSVLPDASFVSFVRWGSLGHYIKPAGDMNGDGYDDMLIGDEDAAYLFLGKASGLELDTPISAADAHFPDVCIVAGAGDVNGDGLDDLVLGSCFASDKIDTAGKVYILLGKSDNWDQDTFITDSEASFLGEAAFDQAGYSVDGMGDIDSDGYDEVLASAPFNNEGGTDAGEVYIIDLENDNHIQDPSIGLYSDPECTQKMTMASMNETVYVEMTTPSNLIDRKETELVRVTSSKSSVGGFRLLLVETEMGTGVFRGYFMVTSVTSMASKSVAASPWENVTVKPETRYKDPGTTLWITAPITLYPQSYNLTATEDEPYIVEYSSTEAPDLFWQFQTDASWLSWDQERHILSGTPANEHVGTSHVRVRVQQAHGPYDEHNFTLKVKNTPPKILTEEIPDAVEDVDYSVDLRSSDDSSDRVSWTLETDAAWLTIDQTTGILSGTPGNGDVGEKSMTVTVDDGNGGSDVRDLILYVRNVNNAPYITNIDDRTAREHQRYFMSYEATDIDAEDELEWVLKTNATKWLSLDPQSGQLFGTPEDTDIGTYWVDVSVYDAVRAKDTHHFTLTVINVNDPPKITSIPDIETKTYVVYDYWMTVTDVDVGDRLTYSIDKGPEGMTMDQTSGHVEWTPTDAQIGKNYVVLAVTDGTATVYQEFKIKVEKAPGSSWPTITSTPGRRVLKPGDTFIYSITVDDKDPGDTFRYMMIDGPHGLFVADDGTVIWNVGEGNADQSYEVVILVMDSYGFEDEQRFTLTVRSDSVPSDHPVRDKLMSIHVEGMMVVIIGLGMVAAARLLMQDGKKGKKDKKKK